jgi:hypothetical protein
VIYSAYAEIMESNGKPREKPAPIFGISQIRMYLAVLQSLDLFNGNEISYNAEYRPQSSMDTIL